MLFRDVRTQCGFPRVTGAAGRFAEMLRDTAEAVKKLFPDAGLVTDSAHIPLLG